MGHPSLRDSAALLAILFSPLSEPWSEVTVRWLRLLSPLVLTSLHTTAQRT
jgi:hypothetical protein